MKIVKKVGERGQVTIPKQFREHFGIATNSTVEFEMRKGEMVIKPKRDMARFDAAVKKWRGTMRADLLADGYKSVDELIEDIRGR